MHFCNHCAKCVAGLQNQCPNSPSWVIGVDGGNCELIAVPAVNVIPIPDNLDFNQAASVPLVFLTAWHMLVGRAGIRPGQTVLVLGASSGVGIAAIQVAKLFHARVITTAGDETKLEKARDLGGRPWHQPLPAEDFRRSEKAHQQGRRGHCIEHVGEATWEQSVKCLKPAGTLVTCGATTGPNARFRFAILYSRPAFAPGLLHGHDGRIVRGAGTRFRWTVEAGGRSDFRPGGCPRRARVSGKEPNVRQSHSQSVTPFFLSRHPILGCTSVTFPNG